MFFDKIRATLQLFVVGFRTASLMVTPGGGANGNTACALVNAVLLSVIRHNCEQHLTHQISII
jgi:hypothetical protein